MHNPISEKMLMSFYDIFNMAMLSFQLFLKKSLVFVSLL
eukprot:UN26895